MAAARCGGGLGALALPLADGLVLELRLEDALLLEGGRDVLVEKLLDVDP